MANILLVDDYREIRDLYADALIKAGHKVKAVESAEQGLLEAQKGGFDLILIDLLMPGKNGVWVLEELKKNPSKIQNKSIIVSGVDHADAGQAKLYEQARALGAKGFIDKHVVHERDLPDLIKEYLV